MTRAAAAFAGGLVCDIILVLAAGPLIKYSLSAAYAPHPNASLIVLLLCGNLLLLALCFCGLGAWCYALFQSFRATQAKVLSDTAAMSRNSTVSSSTTPAN